MKRLTSIFGLAFALLLVKTAMAAPPNEHAETVTIPLDNIWAYQMPGTRDLLKIEGRSSAKLVKEIRDALSTRPPNAKDAPAGFAVAGSGADALPETQAVVVGGKKPRQSLSADDDISVVFFSYQFGPYVHLHKVALRGNVIEIQYRFVPHKTEEVTEHFALIPLGKLAAGKVRVEIIQSPMEQEFVKAGWTSVKPDVARRIVCKSFSFDVVGHESN